MSAQFARQANFVVADVQPGADEPTTFDWALQLNGNSGYVDSGLRTTEGYKILLSMENGIVVGRVDLNNSGLGHSSEPAAFAIHLADDGTLTVVQYMSIKHPDTGNPDDGRDHHQRRDARCCDGSPSSTATGGQLGRCRRPDPLRG